MTTTRTVLGGLALLLIVTAAATLVRPRSVVGQVGAMPTLAPPVGVLCSVQLRRDALGLASRQIIPPSTHTVGGAELVIAGYFRRMDEHWLVFGKVADDEVEIWVPRPSVLTMEMNVGD